MKFERYLKSGRDRNIIAFSIGIQHLIFFSFLHIMKNTVVLIIHLGFWAIWLLLMLVILVASTQGFTYGPKFSYIVQFVFAFVLLPSIITFYLSYFFLFPKFVQTRKIALSFLVGLCIVICSAFLGSSLVHVFLETDSRFTFSFGQFMAETFFVAVVCFIVGLLSVLIKGFIHWYKEIRLKDELQLKNLQVELALTKSPPFY